MKASDPPVPRLLSCWQRLSLSLCPVPAMNRGPSKALQLRAFSQLQATGRTSIHRCQSANPLLCCSERVDSAQGPVMQATALLCMGGVIRGLRFRPHFSDSSGWPDCFSLLFVCCSPLTFSFCVGVWCLQICCPPRCLFLKFFINYKPPPSRCISVVYLELLMGFHFVLWCWFRGVHIPLMFCPPQWNLELWPESSNVPLTFFHSPYFIWWFRWFPRSSALCFPTYKKTFVYFAVTQTVVWDICVHRPQCHHGGFPPHIYIKLQVVSTESTELLHEHSPHTFLFSFSTYKKWKTIVWTLVLHQNSQ